jgi:hypothetical protein
MWEEEEEDSDSHQWLEMFHPFTTLKNLYVIKEFAQNIAPPCKISSGKKGQMCYYPPWSVFFLEEIQLSGPIQEAIGQFVAARQLSGNPIAVSLWKRDPE